jgi:hypothetical protein
MPVGVRFMLDQGWSDGAPIPRAPHEEQGAHQPLDCENALNPLAGATLAKTFTFIAQGLFGDGVVTTVLTGQ